MNLYFMNFITFTNTILIFFNYFINFSFVNYLLPKFLFNLFLERSSWRSSIVELNNDEAGLEEEEKKFRRRI